MFQLIERIQQKTESERRKIHLMLTIGITVLIGVLWFFVQFGQIDSGPAAARESGSPIDTFGDMVSNTLFEFGNIMGDIGDTIVEIRDKGL